MATGSVTSDPRYRKVNMIADRVAPTKNLRIPLCSPAPTRCERGLADLKRIAPHIVAVQFDQVEGIEEDALVSPVVTDEIERGNAVVIAGNSFAIDDAGARAQAGERINDQRETAGEVVARTAIEPHSLAGRGAR